MKIFNSAEYFFIENHTKIFIILISNCHDNILYILSDIKLQVIGGLTAFHADCKND